MNREDEERILERHLKTYAPPVPPAPEDEWRRISQRLTQRRPHRSWVWTSLVMSCAIALLLCVPRPTPIDPEWNEVWNEEPLPDAQAYEAWLDLADAMDEKLP